MKRALIPVLMASLVSIVHPTLAQSPPTLDRHLIFTEGVAELTGQNDSAKISIAVVPKGETWNRLARKMPAKPRGSWRQSKV